MTEFKNTATLDYLDAPVEIKADESKGKGFFAALVSVFGNADRNGDRVMRGAFTKTIERWKQSGNPIPVIWSHQHDSLPSMLGSVDPTDMKETKDGLVVAGRLDIENNPKAAEAFQLLTTGLVTNWSFAFETRDSDIDSDGIRQLKELDIFELGPTLIGANAETRTLALKSAQDIAQKVRDELVPVVEDKAGRRISSATAAKLTAFKSDLQRHIAALDELLEEVEEAAPVTKADRARQEMADVDSFLSERGL